jgi:hypothetical protein
MTTEVSEKNTKAEILKAYEALLKNVQHAKSDIPKNVQEENLKKETLGKVEITNGDNIVKNIGELKTKLNVSLDNMLQKLTDEYNKLVDIRAAIAIEKKTLEDLYSLSANVDSLATILLVHREKKENFEKEIKEQREQWEQEKAKQKAVEKDSLEDRSKQRKREEDEYQYTLKIKRQKEQDEYDNKKSQLEKSLADKKSAFEKDIALREQELKIAETDLTELRKNNSEFPAKLETALKNKEAEITNQLQTKYAFDMKLLEKQTDADIRLKDQIITSLQEKIKEQQTQLKEYSDKANSAETSVKEIALKAIENSSRVHMYTGKSEKEE